MAVTAPSGPAPPTMRSTGGSSADARTPPYRDGDERGEQWREHCRPPPVAHRPMGSSNETMHRRPFAGARIGACPLRMMASVGQSGGSRTTVYQPALDGVRAVSVVAVLLFHAGFSWMTGGYLGVSVFFTLSGFLITRLLVDERERTGRIAAGRVLRPGGRDACCRRASCASSGCALFAAFGAFDGVADLRRDVIGAALQIANWTSLAGADSYAEQLAAEAGQRSPLTHYWSLAIEEQFYWLWPVTVAALAAWAHRGVAPMRRLAVGIGALTVAFGVAAPVIAAMWGGAGRVLGHAGAHRRDPRRQALLAVALRAWPVLLSRTRSLQVLGAAALAAIVVAFVATPEASGFVFHGGLPLFTLLVARCCGRYRYPARCARHSASHRSLGSGASATASTSSTGRCTCCSTSAAPGSRTDGLCSPCVSRSRWRSRSSPTG